MKEEGEKEVILRLRRGGRGLTRGRRVSYSRRDTNLAMAVVESDEDENEAAIERER